MFKSHRQFSLLSANAGFDKVLAEAQKQTQIFLASQKEFAGAKEPISRSALF